MYISDRHFGVKGHISELEHDTQAKIGIFVLEFSIDMVVLSTASGETSML
jgi:hypothetical protein